jgi:hypothetical protein
MVKVHLQLVFNNKHVEEVYRIMRHSDLNMIQYEMLDLLMI